MKQENQTIELAIIQSILSGEVITAEDLSHRFNLSIPESVKILNDPVFLSALGNFTKAKANISFHTRGMSRLIGMLNSDDDKVALSAIKTLAQYTGNIESKGNEVNVNLNLESTLTNMEKLVGSGSSQKQLPESKVIDIIPKEVMKDFDWLES